MPKCAKCEQLTCIDLFSCFRHNMYKINTVVVLWCFDTVVVYYHINIYMVLESTIKVNLS